MKPTALLIDEHKIIEQVLNCLERMVEQCDSEGQLDQGPARDAIVFFKTVTEHGHLRKEETQVLAALEATGINIEDNLAEQTLQEHDRYLAHLQGMEVVIDAASAGDRDAMRQFVDHGHAYIELLMNRIEREEDWLFPTADRTLDDQQQRDLLAAMHKTGTKTPDAIEAFLMEIANQLADHFGVPRAKLSNEP